MAPHEIRFVDSSFCKADNRDSLRTHLTAPVPEDGLDSDDEDLQQGHISTNWVVRNTFLELDSDADEHHSLRMRLYKTDSCLGGMGSSDKESNDSTACSSSTSSTRESFADEVGRILSTEADNSPRYRFQTDEDLSFTVAHGSYGPRSTERCPTQATAATTEPTKTEGKSSTRAEFAVEKLFVALARAAALDLGEFDAQALANTAWALARADLQDEQLTMSVPPFVQLVPAPMMVLSPSAVQVKTQVPAPAVPPGNFSKSTVSPGKFSQPAMPPGNFIELASEAKKDPKAGLDQQEQKFRLLSTSNASSTQAPQKLVVSWNQCEVQSYRSTSKRSQTEVKPHDRTTVVLCDLPEGFSRDMVADLLNSQGLQMKFDFIYTPVKFSTMVTIGYAFVNFVSHEAAKECLSRLSGFTGWATPCENSLSTLWSEKDQGLAAIIDRHRNSPVMHESVKEEFKPALYIKGVRAAFPRPTKKIKAPRVQRYNRDDVNAEGVDEEYEVTDPRIFLAQRV